MSRAQEALRLPGAWRAFHAGSRSGPGGVVRGVWTTGEARKLTVEEWADRWLASHESHLKRTTAATYRTALRTAIIPTFGAMPLGNVRPIDVAEWLAKLTANDKSAGWVRQCYRRLSMSCGRRWRTT
jgi:hypothetical protein